MSELVLPRQVQIHTTMTDGPLATSIGVVQSQPGQVSVLALGGAYRDEILAAEVLGNLLPHSQGQTEDMVLEEAFEWADKIMEFGARRRKEKAEIKSGE